MKNLNRFFTCLVMLTLPAFFLMIPNTVFGQKEVKKPGEPIPENLMKIFNKSCIGCHSTKGNVMGSTTSNCVSEQTVLADRNAANDTYFVFFTLDVSDATNAIIAGDMLQGRLRRIAASSSPITGEVIVWDWAVMWRTSKVFGPWTVETNDI